VPHFNYGFETGPEGWTWVESPATGTTTSTLFKYAGAKSLKVNVSGSGNPRVWIGAGRLPRVGGVGAPTSSDRACVRVWRTRRGASPDGREPGRREDRDTRAVAVESRELFVFRFNDEPTFWRSSAGRWTSALSERPTATRPPSTEDAAAFSYISGLAVPSNGKAL
jgi:hypothetical protein